MTQNEALAVMKTGTNVFLTGEPGSGKTYTVNQYTKWLREHGINVAITASTGIAATHIGGMTIHSWSGIGVKQMLSSQDLKRISGNKRVADRIRNAHVLVIDETSMLSARTFALVEMACRAVRGGIDPFGGLQVILVGDFFQLPPVVRKQEYDPFFDAGMFEVEDDTGLFAYASPAWKSLNLEVCYLSEQHRQEDPVFLEFLLSLRGGVVTSAHRTLLESRRNAAATRAEGTHLFSHNIDVDRLNDRELEKLPGEAKVFPMQSDGSKELVLILQKGCLSPEILALKIGSRVMFTKNDQSYHYVNGTLGVVTGFSEKDGYPIVKTNSGRTILAEPEDWKIEEDEKTLARITQIPLRLAWAITIHKSQGMSLDAAHMDLSGVFEHGQGYVALSRVRTLAGLSLAGWNEKALQINPEIQQKDFEFRAASQKAEMELRKRSLESQRGCEDEFIRVCHGSIEAKPVEEHDIERSASRERPWERTLALLKEGMSIEDIAEERGRAVGTILDHVEELMSLKKISPDDLIEFFVCEEATLPEIQKAFRMLGLDRLRPVYDYFEGRISYDTLRFARMLIEE
jgi:hypothetical protein